MHAPSLLTVGSCGLMFQICCSSHRVPVRLFVVSQLDVRMVNILAPCATHDLLDTPSVYILFATSFVEWREYLNAPFLGIFQ
jgi:hypothetical protein